MDLKRSVGLNPDGSAVVPDRAELIRYLNLKLEALGQPTAESAKATNGDAGGSHDLLARYCELSRLLEAHLCPIDQRIQDFLDGYLAGETLNGSIRLPGRTLDVDRHGLARELSLPVSEEKYRGELLESYRIRQGVLHNPKSDRRTTEGVFHVAEGGLPIPADKRAVPKIVYGNLLHAALNPPAELLKLPFTAGGAKDAAVFCTLLLRPTVCPEVPGFTPRRTMEVRFFAPGSLVSNLDFVESIFGNAGDPYLPENDAALDVQHWTGHTGCVILAPHLVRQKKKALGLPHWDKATARQRKDGMCYKSEDELYNDGGAFKVTARTEAGVMVTLIADNYYGYSKKEVKTQIGYAANLFGVAEEEHAGGALAFQSYSLGEQFDVNTHILSKGYTFAEAMKLRGDRAHIHPEGYAVDKTFPDIVYVPEDVRINLPEQKVSWTKDGKPRELPLLPGNVYVHPAGYKVRMEKHRGAPSWRLVGTVAAGTFCHKPCTVSGGGKSEISKSIADAILYGPIYTANIKADLDAVQAILDRDFSDRFRPKPGQAPREPRRRPILDPSRSLGSVIKLLTPSPADYTDAHNAYLEHIPNHIRSIVFFIKRFYRPEWGTDWRSHFTVDDINGAPGHELKFDNRNAVGSYLRIGLTESGNWRLYKLRQDFIAADKVQMEDDISASAVVPASIMKYPPLGVDYAGLHPSVKIVENCEYRLFQRPDEAIHRGFDQQTELDMSKPGLFVSNYKPVTGDEAADMAQHTIEFEKFTAPMRDTLKAAAGWSEGYVVSSAHPRIVEGKPTKNPRYLQVRPDVARPRDRYLAEVGARLFRRIPADEPVVWPVSAVLSGRRNNPPDAAGGVRALAPFNPIHYQELPELFMDFVCSLTGKSPSTTGAGSEGALTKGPFNALSSAPDLNNALVSFILTGYAGYSTAAGYVGPHMRVDHDVSLLIPEIWARLTPEEREPGFLIQGGYLEEMKDFEHEGRKVLASRLGWRITAKFVHDFFGRVFDNPSKVFDEQTLEPEKQDLAAYVDSIDNIVEAQERVANQYFEDGLVEELCPPLKALVHAMAGRPLDGKPVDISSPTFRQMFTRESLLASDWYRQRLQIKQQRDAALWQRHVASLESFLGRESHRDVSGRMNLSGRLDHARAELAAASAPAYLDRLSGTIGADPLGRAAATTTTTKKIVTAIAAAVGVG